MISTKEKNKSPKDSMTLLPCFYFVEVSGGLVALVGEGQRPQFRRPSGTPTPRDGHRSRQPRVQAQLGCLGVGVGQNTWAL